MRKSWLLWLVTIVFAWVLLTHWQELTQLGRTGASGQWQWLLLAFGLQLLYYIAYTGVYHFAFATVDVRSNLWELLPVIVSQKSFVPHSPVREWDKTFLDIYTYAALFANLVAPTGGMAGAALVVDDVALAQVVQETSLGAMRQRAQAGEAGTHLSQIFQGGAKTFFNQGTNGRWQGVLTEAELTMYEQTKSKVLTPDCARWLELGRAGLG